MGTAKGVFNGCENLSEVEFRGTPSLEYIGANTFYVTALSEFEIPASVTYIGFSAFLNEYLVSLSVEDGNEVYVADEGVLYTKDMTHACVLSVAESGNFLYRAGGSCGNRGLLLRSNRVS